MNTLSHFFFSQKWVELSIFLAGPVFVTRAQFVYEISPLIFGNFYNSHYGKKVPLKIPIFFIPISLFAVNGNNLE